MQETTINAAEVPEEKPKRVQSKWYQYPGVNLRFLLEFMKALRMNTESICKAASQPPQSLRIQLKRDDMKLSKAKFLIKANGYNLNVRLIPKEQTDANKGYIVTLPNIKKKPEEPKNLSFLKEFMTSVGESQYAVADKLHVTQAAVNAWFKTDDILISYIVKIKEVYNLDLEFRITENTENK